MRVADFIIVTILFACIGADTALAQVPIIFDHARTSGFKWLDSRVDVWDEDKGEHYIANYLLVKAVGNDQMTSSLLAFALAANVFKEIEDGYREGFSWRDLTAGMAGITAAKTGLPIIVSPSRELSGGIVILFYFTW